MMRLKDLKQNSDLLIDMPEAIKAHFLEVNGNFKGVYPVDGEVKNWLKQQLNLGRT